MTRLAAVLAALLLLAGAAPASAVGPWHHGISTFYSWQQYGCGRFGSWRISCARRGGLACKGTYGRMTLGVAHLSLPCGALVQLRYAGRTITVPVIDRGPYTRGLDFDLTTATCEAIRHCLTGPLDWRLAP